MAIAQVWTMSGRHLQISSTFPTMNLGWDPLCRRAIGDRFWAETKPGSSMDIDLWAIRLHLQLRSVGSNSFQNVEIPKFPRRDDLPLCRRTRLSPARPW